MICNAEERFAFMGGSEVGLCIEAGIVWDSRIACLVGVTVEPIILGWCEGFGNQ